METLRVAVSRSAAFIPDLIAGFIVLAIGWMIAAVLRRLVVGLLPRAGFDRFLAKHGVTNRAPEQRSGSNAVGSAVFWVSMLVALMQAAYIWRLGFVAVGLARLLAYLPNVLAAIAIFGAAFLVGNWVSDRLRETRVEARAYGAFLPGLARAAILTVGGFVALRQLQIAPEILIIGFSLVFGAVAVAGALAFGIGGRRAAERMSDDWYEAQRARRAKLSDEENLGSGEPEVH
jgi:Conserved TM helix